MREKLETLPLPELRAIAKAKGMKKISTLKKGELIDLLVQSEEEIEAEENQKVQKQEIKKQDIKPIENKTPQREPMVALELPRKDTTSGQPAKFTNEEIAQLDSGIVANGILEVMPDGYGFIRCENYMPGENDVYVSPAQIRKLNLKTGDIVVGILRTKTQNEKFAALLYVKSINGFHPMEATKRKFAGYSTVCDCLETVITPSSKG